MGEGFTACASLDFGLRESSGGFIKVGDVSLPLIGDVLLMEVDIVALGGMELVRMRRVGEAGSCVGLEG